MLLDDGDKDVDRYCDPDLRPYGILGGAIETFDTKMLLDPI